VLIDAGPPDGSTLLALSRVYEGRALDAIVITHSDRDHSGGLEELQRRMRVGRVLDGEPTGEGAPGIEHFDIGDRIRLGERTTIEVLSPPVVTATSAHREDNNRSLVLLVTIGERRVLLAADIEEPAEQWLATSGLNLRADAFVVPHHGSRTSSTPAFVRAVSPAVAVISVGAGNPHGHPHPEVVDAYAAVPLLRTDLDGDVTLRSDGTRMWVESAR
jgi:competence protein ComEC